MTAHGKPVGDAETRKESGPRGSPLAATYLALRAISAFILFVLIVVLGYTVLTYDKAANGAANPLVQAILIAIAAAFYTIALILIVYHSRVHPLLWLATLFDLAWCGAFCFLAIGLAEPAVGAQCNATSTPHPLAASSTTSANVLAGDLAARRHIKRDITSPLREFVLVGHVPCSVVLAFWIPCLALVALFGGTAIVAWMRWRSCGKTAVLLQSGEKV